jgi:hypothetical protein
MLIFMDHFVWGNPAQIKCTTYWAAAAPWQLQIDGGTNIQKLVCAWTAVSGTLSQTPRRVGSGALFVSEERVGGEEYSIISRPPSRRGALFGPKFATPEVNKSRGESVAGWTATCSRLQSVRANGKVLTAGQITGPSCKLN